MLKTFLPSIPTHACTHPCCIQCCPDHLVPLLHRLQRSLVRLLQSLNGLFLPSQLHQRVGHVQQHLPQQSRKERKGREGGREGRREGAGRGGKEGVEHGISLTIVDAELVPALTANTRTVYAYHVSCELKPNHVHTSPKITVRKDMHGCACTAYHCVHVHQYGSMQTWSYLN